MKPNLAQTNLHNYRRIDSSRDASIVSDISSLNTIRQLGQQDKLAAINKAAKEFEGFFLNMMLKSMRAASEVIGDDSPLNSNEQKMFVGMLDEQLSNNLSTKGSLGIASLLVEQMARIEGLNINSKNNDLETRAQASTIKQKSAFNVRNSSLIHAINKPQISSISHRGKSETNSVESLSTKSIDEIKQESVTFPAKGIHKSTVASRQSLFDSANDFVNSLIPYAKKAARLLNTDPKVVLAQAALETGWGKYVMHDEAGQSGFNLFGIKASSDWRGKKIETSSLEVESGQFKPVKSEFRSYQNYAEAFDDYVKFLVSNPRYENVVSSEKPEDFAKALQKSGYATDPNYSNKIMRIFNSDILQKITMDSD